MSMRSAWPALGISVLTAVALFVAQLMIVLWPEALWLHDSPIETITVTLWLFSCVGAIAAVGAMLFGPLWLMISAALRLSGVVGYFLAGTIAGALVGLPTASLLVSPDRDTIRVWDQQDHTGEFALTVVWFAALGFSIAAIYWLIRRPDLDAAEAA